MSLIIMKFLKVAVIFIVWGGASLSSGNEESFDLERIKVQSGKVYRNILILEGDAHGLTFRHEDGIAKVPYDSLSMNLRMLYQPVGDLPEGEAGNESAPDIAVEMRGKGDSIESIPVVIQLRTYSRGRQEGLGHHSSSVPSLGYMPGYRAPWKSHWGRYPLALSLANPRYRALAVQDFLSVAFPHSCSSGHSPYPVPRATYYARYW